MEGFPTGIAGIRVLAQGALSEVEVLLGNDLVEREGAAVDDLAGITVAVIVSLENVPCGSRRLLSLTR